MITRNWQYNIYFIINNDICITGKYIFMYFLVLNFNQILKEEFCSSTCINSVESKSNNMTITWQSHHTLTTLVLPSLACCHTNSLLPREMPKQCHYGLSLSGYFHLISDYSTYSKNWDVWMLLICLPTWSRAQSQLCTVHCPGPGYGDSVKPTKLFIEDIGSREVEWLCYYLTKASLYVTWIT